jgi:hypothetical protein
MIDLGEGVKNSNADDDAQLVQCNLCLPFVGQAYTSGHKMKASWE